MKDSHSIQNKIAELTPLKKKLEACSTFANKLEVLKNHNKMMRDGIDALDLNLQVVIESLFAIDQGKRIFEGVESYHTEDVRVFLETLLPVEAFYKEIGGIVGYHIKFLELLIGMETHPTNSKKYEKPPIYDLTLKVNSHVKNGIKATPEMAEIYPIAGAADRLDLKDTKTGEPLPAASLEFLGYTLLEGLVRDAIGKEYLYYKLENKQATTPFVLMTSIEKNNHTRVHEILESKNWFGRPQHSYYFVHQPLVPVLCHNGQWAVKGSLTIALKPGGHGVIWKLLQDQGAFEWLKRNHHHKVLIRQINNPIAGVDNGLFALTGIGSGENKIFGFSSCDRYVKSEEGMDVLIKEKTQEGHRYTITNVEYTEFDHQGVKDVPKDPESPFSQFPANSNILYADLKALEKIIKEHPFPGLMINLKSEASLKLESGEVVKVPAARLETTMQNIADYLTYDSSAALTEEQQKHLPTFVTHNLRRKTLSATKRSMQNNNLRDTPEGTHLQVLKNSKELLELSGFTVPAINDEDYLKNGPSFLFTYNPALGPVYQIIQQKLQKGTFHEKAELKLEIADILIKDLDLKGSLLIQADQIAGHMNARGIREYSAITGKCILENVKIDNKGIDSSLPSIFWKYQIHRKEFVKIQIEGNGEFYAKDIIFKGNYNIIVPSGKKMTAIQNAEIVEFLIESIKAPSWGWNYSFNDKDDIILHFDNYGGKK